MTETKSSEIDVVDIENLDDENWSPESIRANTNTSKQTSVDFSRWVNKNLVEMDRDDRVVDNSVPLSKRMLYHLRRRMLFADDFIQVAASVGGHLAELQQMPEHNPDPIRQDGVIRYIGVPGGKGVPFAFHGGVKEVLNIPLVLVGPAGMSKSLVMSNYFNSDNGICPLPAFYQGNITEAGFSAKEGKEGKVNWGTAKLLSNGFGVFNEISNIFYSNEASHSRTLINQVLEATGDKHVTKFLGSEDMKFIFDTSITLIGGTQNDRFDFTSGMGRRFEFITRDWTPQDIEQLRLLWLNEKLSTDCKVKVNTEEIKRIRKDIERIYDRGCITNEPVWDETFVRYLYDNMETHTMLQMASRTFVGFAYLNQHPGEDEIIRIEDNKFNRAMVAKIKNNRERLSTGGDYGLMLSVLSNKELTFYELWAEFRKFSYNMARFNELRGECIKNGIISTKHVTGRGSVYYVPAGITK